MTPASLQRALIDLGWLTLIQRVLGGKPSAAYALFQLMRSAGRPLLYEDFVGGYEGHMDTGGSLRASVRGRMTNTKCGISKRIERARSYLADLGVEGAIRTPGGGGYVLERRDLSRVQAALLGACGIQLEPEDMAA